MRSKEIGLAEASAMVGFSVILLAAGLLAIFSQLGVADRI